MVIFFFNLVKIDPVLLEELINDRAKQYRYFKKHDSVDVLVQDSFVRDNDFRKAVQEAGYDYESAEANFLPSVSVDLDEEGARKVFRLIEALEDSDDVQNVYANFDVSDAVMEAVG